MTTQQPPAPPRPQAPPPLTAAVASLHRQAHPTQGRYVAFCREEPCRSLSLEQLRQIGAQ